MAELTQLPDLPDVQMVVVGTLGLSPEQLTERCGITFSELKDDLDGFVWASVEVDGTPMVLLRHLRSPEAGAVLYAPAGAEDPGPRLLEALKARTK